MCGRYSLSTTAELVEEVFGAEAPDDLARRWNIAPSEPAPIVRGTTGGRRLDRVPWGIAAEVDRSRRGTAPPLLINQRGERVASPDVGEQTAVGGRLLVNARSETVATLPSFRDSFRARRCLVPADGFYEWASGQRGRVPHHVRFRDRRLFAFAGIWARREERDAQPREQFAILTCPPSELVRPLHDRMPVILPAEAWEEWLHGDDPAALQALLVPWEGPEIEAVPVGPYVNRAGNEGPECLAPPVPPAQRSLFS
jgi:putative SOS response-associated peptidase YedK